MKKINLTININHYQKDELTPGDSCLVEKAIEATNNAYAEYSRFYVGAAALLEDGTIVTGANQEKCSFSFRTVC